MKKTVKKVLLIILIPLLILGAFLFGFIKGSEWGWKANLPSPFEKIINKEPPKELPAGDMSLFWDTWQVILDKYRRKLLQKAAFFVLGGKNRLFVQVFNGLQYLWGCLRKQCTVSRTDFNVDKNRFTSFLPPSRMSAKKTGRFL